MRYCGVWDQQSVFVEIDEDDQAVICILHELYAGESDERIAEVCMTYLQSDQRLLAYAKRHGGVQ
jgi:hypothetical protein